MKTEMIICSTCGQKSEKSAAELKRQRKTGRSSFYCSRKCAGAVTGGYKPTQDATRYNISQHCNNRNDEFSLFRRHLRRAQRRKWTCNLTLEHLKNIWTGKCALTGIPIHITKNENMKGKDLRQEASLDRIDPSKGYLIGNVQWVCTPINLAKTNMTQEMVLEWICLIKQ